MIASRPLRSRRGVASIANAVNSGKSSALAMVEETLVRLAAYDIVQPQIWISRATRGSTAWWLA